MYLGQNIFKIPAHIILEEDAVHKEHPTASNSTFVECEEEIQTLTKKLTSVLNLHIFFCTFMPPLSFFWARAALPGMCVPIAVWPLSELLFLYPVLFCDGTSRYGVPENLTTG